MHPAFPTVELRWFQEGATPAGVLDWLQALGPAEKQIPRVDYYLRLADEPALGVKLRDGRLEIKKRTVRYGEVQIQSKVAGVLEGWRKWAFVLIDPGLDLHRSPDKVSPWLPVRKARQLLRFALVGDRRLLIQGRLRPERGCEIELTSVSLGMRRWWTLGLEAYGPESSVKNDLMAAARDFFEGEGPLALEVVDSYGYPEWLGRLPASRGE
jgi:hypothetical protein